MENKYQEGKIYKIVCNITGEIYIGSTIQYLCDRLATHKFNMNCMSKQIIDRGDYKIELIKDYPCNNVWELEEEEAKYIRENKCINIVIPHRTHKEWIEDNKEDHSQKMKKWREENREAHLKQRKEYREKNKEEISKKQKEYYSQKITCECGCIVSKSSIYYHRKSLKHLRKMECLIID